MEKLTLTDKVCACILAVGIIVVLYVWMLACIFIVAWIGG